ncbi:MAG: hypothetical protein E6Q91_03865 [Actinobacteria bacterium]|nr:MAG: hypothetical protein E6Q91_03865 [Actinomycetota bacterium]
MSEGTYWGSGEFEGQVWDNGQWRLPTPLERSAHQEQDQVSNWQSAMLKAQTQTARDVATIKNIVIIYFVLSIIGAVIIGLVFLAAYQESTSGYY